MPLTVSFTSALTGGVSPYSYDWEFGDGSRSNAANTVHIYLTGGNFSVWLIADDSAGQSEVSNVMWVNVTPAAVNLTVSTPSVFVRTSAGTMVTLRATVSGGTAPYTYLWDFGDGGTSTEVAPTHLYAAPAKYHVQVRVTDSKGQVATYSFDLAVPAIGVPRLALDPLWIADTVFEANRRSGNNSSPRASTAARAASASRFVRTIRFDSPSSFNKIRASRNARNNGTAGV